VASIAYKAVEAAGEIPGLCTACSAAICDRHRDRRGVIFFSP